MRPANCSRSSSRRAFPCVHKAFSHGLGDRLGSGRARCSWLDRKAEFRPCQKNRIEIQFGVESALDRLRSAEAVLLAIEQQILQRQTFGFERRYHRLRLVGRDDWVIRPLEKDDRNSQALDEMNG